MTPADRQALLQLFVELLELEPAERERRLDRLRSDEPATAEELERLLAADDGSGPLDRLQDEVGAAAERRLSAYELSTAPATLGPWRLVERIGTGGMGEVWKAERNEGGFSQVAALKLVRLGMATEAVFDRFLLERQLLARLTHSAIARLYDGGVAPDGRPWFAMEHVVGRPITDFARGRPIEETLRLFVAVLDAVDFAHRNLIVHRDLKPSNILVTASGEPKLLDFGLAKLLDPELDPGLTRTELRALTPAYAAPEQVLGEPVTTATDVYSLGVLLYELLTGRLPHRREGRTEAALAGEVRRETIERPSLAVRQLAASTRQGQRLARRLAGDLDTIVLQALRREPGRRYASAAAFADDLRRFLDGRPVAARADTLAYRASKFLRRHYLGVAATGLLIAALVAGLVGTTWQARRAERQAARAERVQAFLVGLFEAADPDKSRGARITAQELLAEGSLQLERGLEKEPDVRAEMLDTVSQIERRLGLFEAAERHARSALELRRRDLPAQAPDSVEAARARLSLAEALDGRGDMTGAATEIERALAVLQAALGPDSDDVARARSGELAGFIDRGDAAGGLAVAQQLLDRQRRRRGARHPDTGVALYEVGQMQEAGDRFAEAEATYGASLEILDATLGPGNASTEMVRMALAEVVGYRGDRQEAERLFRQTIEGFIRTRGEGHVLVAQARLKMALVLISDGRFAEADEALKLAYATFEPLGHFDATSCLRLMGSSLFSQGRIAEAAEKFRAAFERFRVELSPSHSLTFVAQANLGGAEVRLGRLAEGRANLDAAIAGLTALSGPEADTLRQPLAARGEAERRLGQPEVALATHRRLLAIAEKTVGPTHVGAANAHREIALDLEASGGRANLLEARHEIERAVEIRRAADPNPAKLAEALADLARIAGALGDGAAAESARESAAALGSAAE